MNTDSNKASTKVLPMPGIPREPSIEAFNRAECIAAIRGESVPKDVKLAIARAALIRGIRSHRHFATNEKVQNLCTQYLELARARNARLLMSNEIPDGLEQVATQPYCIWHPDFATVDTYRKLVGQFPSMRYQVGRACAAAGYSDLYRELDLLPDVSIAEEARESKTEGGNAIFRSIIDAKIRYAVMDDVTRSINVDDPKVPAYLNGDTAVRWSLTIRRPLANEDAQAEFLETDIEEDWRLDDGQVESQDDIHELEYISIEESKLLYSPLPQDLPTVKKDLLIQMAAYEGNIDRYARLMRPHFMTELELMCVIRGIYHHTMFARWWDDQLKSNTKRLRTPDRSTEGVFHRLCQAINARRIMINEISTFDKNTQHLPHLIWWPLQPRQETLAQLAEQCPAMKLEIAVACIKCDYQRLYTQLEPKVHSRLKLAAKQSPNSFYLQDIDKRAGDQAASLDVSEMDLDAQAIDTDLEPTGTSCAQPIAAHLMTNGIALWGPYFGDRADPNMIERYVWQDLDLLRKYERIYGPSAWDGDLAPTVADSDEDENGAAESA